MASTLARNIISKSAVRCAGQGDAMYVVASDQTVWMLTMSATAAWMQLPSIPQPATGARNILDITASRWPGMADSLYAHCDDGTLEAAQRIAGYADSRTTKLYDRRDRKVLLEDKAHPILMI